MITIELTKKLFGATSDIHLEVSLNINQGEVVTLYGPSGAGKTSILRMIAGVFTPDKGKIIVNGKTWFDKSSKVDLTPQMRSVGIVFQDYALFPNMTVKENICYGLEKNQSHEIVDELIRMMELDKLHNKMPQVLSGGQRQRVALARAIVRKPKLLLLDEPFAALDTELRLRMQEYILSAHRQFDLTTILVSHDILEVLKLSDKVFVLDNGKVARAGIPAAVMPISYLRDMIHTLEQNLKPGS